MESVRSSSSMRPRVKRTIFEEDGLHKGLYQSIPAGFSKGKLCSVEAVKLLKWVH